jgi:hypothetical protein
MRKLVRGLGVILIIAGVLIIAFNLELFQQFMRDAGALEVKYPQFIIAAVLATIGIGILSLKGR